jgi:hypothetical protein
VLRDIEELQGDLDVIQGLRGADDVGEGALGRSYAFPIDFSIIADEGWRVLIT